MSTEDLTTRIRRINHILLNNGTVETERVIACLADAAAALANPPAAQPEGRWLPDVDALAQEIRRVDGSHSLGAGALAEKLVEWLNSLASHPVVAQTTPAAQARRAQWEKWEGAEDWEALAWALCAEENGEEACEQLVWEGGPQPEPWGDRWLKYEPEAKRMIELVRKHVPAPAVDRGLSEAARYDAARKALTNLQEQALKAGNSWEWVEFESRAIVAVLALSASDRHQGVETEPWRDLRHWKGHQVPAPAATRAGEALTLEAWRAIRNARRWLTMGDTDTKTAITNALVELRNVNDDVSRLAASAPSQGEPHADIFPTKEPGWPFPKGDKPSRAEPCSVCGGNGYFQEPDSEVGHVTRECEGCAPSAAEARLTEEARVGHVSFGIGVPERMVVEAAKRAAQHPQGDVDKEAAKAFQAIITENAERAAFLDAHPAVSKELGDLIEENERLRDALATPAGSCQASGGSWTRVEDGLPEDGDLVLCEFEEGALNHFPVNDGFMVERWVESQPVAGVVRWIRIDKIPETMAECDAIQRLKFSATPAGRTLTAAAQDMLAERERQVSVEGWTPEHDDEHKGGGMAFAAAAYASHAHGGPNMSTALWRWTGWASRWFKPKNPRHDLIRAGGLILAEIERLDRAAASTTGGDA